MIFEERAVVFIDTGPAPGTTCFVHGWRGSTDAQGESLTTMGALLQVGEAWAVIERSPWARS
ncbi:MAG: hypothetical protein DHS20C21_09120 [Gemmatimonadota bacterium]|nr:MAG: hypothetical protein DHS20C21_09120 [Gemmatimonadota bacterium]